MSKVSGWEVRHHGASFLCVSDKMIVEGMLSGAVYCGGGGAGAAPEEADGKGYKKVNLQPSPAEPSPAKHRTKEMLGDFLLSLAPRPVVTRPRLLPGDSRVRRRHEAYKEWQNLMCRFKLG